MPKRLRVSLQQNARPGLSLTNRGTQRNIEMHHIGLHINPRSWLWQHRHRCPTLVLFFWNHGAGRLGTAAHQTARLPSLRAGSAPPAAPRSQPQPPRPHRRLRESRARRRAGWGSEEEQNDAPGPRFWHLAHGAKGWLVAVLTQSRPRCHRRRQRWDAALRAGTARLAAGTALDTPLRGHIPSSNPDLLPAR